MTSVIERVYRDFTIPYDDAALKSGNPLRMADAIFTMVKALEEILKEFRDVIGYEIDLADGEAVYFALKGTDGAYPDGTWRIRQSGDNLVREVKISGTWENAGTWERPV